MENVEEAIRLEVKTEPEAVREQALWCGLKPGQRVLDAGCGPGMITSILYEMVQPGGTILGVDYSEERICHAREHYGREGIDFKIHDLRYPLESMGRFDFIWARFVLEYNRAESPIIVRNLTDCLKPNGHLCLLDLDHNCLNHYELPAKMEKVFSMITKIFEQKLNFDPFAGRKLYSYLYDLDYENIKLNLVAHHLIYGKVRDKDIFNWIKKMEVVSLKTEGLFAEYPGGHDAFFGDFKRFFLDPRRFTYTPLILCKGVKPLSVT